MSRRLLILCDWLPPDFGAVGQYMALRAAARAEAGDRVVLVGLASGEHPAPKVPGVVVLVVQRPRYDKTRLLARAWWTLLTNARLLWACRSAWWQADEVTITGSPPFMLWFAAPWAWLTRRRLRYRITDFYPEVLMAESAPRKPGLALRLVHGLTTALRRRVDRIEAIGLDQRQRLLASGVPADRIEIDRDPSPVAFAPGLEPAKRPVALAGRKCVLYSGNYGVAHDAETFVAAMALIERRYPQQVGVWLNATGSRVAEVQGGLEQAGVCVARTPPCALADLPAVLLAADVHLITLRSPFWGFVLPSKVYACIASGRPIMYIGPQESDVHQLARGLSAYRHVAPGDPAAAAAALAALLEL